MAEVGVEVIKEKAAYYGHDRLYAHIPRTDIEYPWSAEAKGKGQVASGLVLGQANGGLTPNGETFALFHNGAPVELPPSPGNGYCLELKIDGHKCWLVSSAGSVTVKFPGGVPSGFATERTSRYGLSAGDL